MYAPGGRVVDQGDLSVDSIKARDHDAVSKASGESSSVMTVEVAEVVIHPRGEKG